MKKLYVLLVAAFGLTASAQTVYSENFGIPSGTSGVAFATYATGTAPATFNNGAPIVYSGTGDVRKTTVSTGYAGASGDGNAFLTGTAGKYLQIDGINTSAYSSANLQMTFGYLTGATATALVLEFSTNASATTPTWTPITFTNNANTTWNLVSIPGGVLPASATLSLRFTQPATAQMRIDDIKISNVSAGCTISLGVTTTACDAITSALDTYTATIPFTGAGNATFTVQSSAGVVGGDNPTTTAAGNIIITGLVEGTSATVTVSAGAGCTQTTTVTGPDCKPVNALPFYEPFNYAVGVNIGNTQTWTNVNTGNEVPVVASNLSVIGGPQSTGNAAQILGAGKDPWTGFTPVSTGAIYNAFMMKVADYGTIADAKEAYFYSLTGASASSYLGRLYIKRSGTQFALGFDSASTTTNYTTNLYNVGDTLLVVIAFDFTTLTYNVWINPDMTQAPNLGVPTLTKTVTTAPTAIGGVQLRQDQTSTTPTIIIDEIRVATDLSQFMGVAQYDGISGLRVYPNPVTRGMLTIATDLGMDKQVEFTDMLGKVVYRTQVSGNEPISTTALQAGAYLVRITENGQMAVRKLMIQ